MYEKIYLKESNLRPHLDAPLRKERENYILQMEEKGLCIRYLQIASKYLLFAVRVLNLRDGCASVVLFEEIKAASQTWREMKLESNRRKNTAPDVDTKTNDFVCTTIKWLSGIHRLDARFYEEDNLFNLFNTLMVYKLKYFCAPLYKERIAYLQYQRQRGMGLKTLREYAETQLFVINMLGLVVPCMVHEEEVWTALTKWDRTSQGRHKCQSRKGHCSFRTVAFGWLRYVNLLNENHTPVYEGYKLESYYDWIITEKGLSKETKKSRRIELQQFTTFLHSNGLTIENVSAEILDSYIQFRHNSGCNRKSIGTIVTSLRDFLRYANIRGWLPVDLSSSLRGPRQFSLEQLPYAANWKDVQRLVDFYSGDSPACKRNRAIIVMFAVYGIRTSELTNLKIKDIDWGNEIITLHRAKRGRSQALPLMPIVGNALIRYFKESRRNDLGKTHLFINLLAPYDQMSTSGVYQVVSQAYHKLGISLEHVGAHSLRHSCASHLVNSGHSLKEVSDLLGHKQLDTTRVYAKIDLPNLRKVADINWEGLL
jgi:integrase/recombinase XerD